MSNTICKLTSPRELARAEALLEAEGIERDRNLDYTCGILDEDDSLVATGSCFGSTIRCLAVSSAHQGEGLLNQVMEHLMEVQMERGNSHLFLYTKPSAARFMMDLGFYEIARVEGKLVFLENRRNGFAGFCRRLQKAEGERIAAVVMNANPFTLGHLHLVERVARENDVVHVFVLSENAGPIPARVRKKLVQEGVAHLSNVVVQDSGPYIISSATFPSYFLKDDDTVIRTQAELDLRVFGAIAKELGIQRRYVGQEHFSHVTALYNEVMGQLLPGIGMEFVEIPRCAEGPRVISASRVRQAIHDGDLEAIRTMVPESTWRYFSSPEAEPVIRAIQRESDVIHY